jgi:hypothetical protein
VTFSETVYGWAHLTCMTASPRPIDDHCDMSGQTASGLKE